MQNKQVFQISFIVLNTQESSTTMYVVHFEYENSHQNKPLRIRSGMFRRNFHANLLEKDSKF